MCCLFGGEDWGCEGGAMGIDCKEKIESIPIFLFDPSMAERKDESHTKVKFVCQFPYEDCNSSAVSTVFIRNASI